MRARVLVSLALGLALGCGPGEAPGAEPAEPPSTEAAAEPEAPSTPGPAPSAPVGGGAGTEPAPAEAGTPPAGICERARACCRAYVAAIPSARRPLEERGCREMDTVLTEAGEVQDEACEAAIGGWRQSLQLTGLEVPADCL
jgi:hypothetical protein